MDIRSKTIYRLITLLLCIGLCICFFIRFAPQKGKASGPYDGIDTGESSEMIISKTGRTPDRLIDTDCFYADSVMIYDDFSYLDMSGSMMYWMKDGVMVMSVFYPYDFDYRRDTELEYRRRFERDFKTAELSSNGYSPSTVTDSFTVTSPVKSSQGASQYLTLVLRYHRRDAIFILRESGVPDIFYLINDIQEVLNGK